MEWYCSVKFDLGVPYTIALTWLPGEPVVTDGVGTGDWDYYGNSDLGQEEFGPNADVLRVGPASLIRGLGVGRYVAPY